MANGMHSLCCLKSTRARKVEAADRNPSTIPAVTSVCHRFKEMYADFQGFGQNILAVI